LVKGRKVEKGKLIPKDDVRKTQPKGRTNGAPLQSKAEAFRVRKTVLNEPV